MTNSASLTQEAILQQFDKTALIIVKIMIAVFLTISCIFCLVFSVGISAFILYLAVLRKLLVFVFSYSQQPRRPFALAGGC